MLKKPYPSDSMAPHRNVPTARGFTLVELSMVMVIIGLLVGGVLTGRSLLRAADIRSVISDLEQYSTAVNIFEEKYAALPGDMANATEIWGAQDGGDGLGVDCTNTASTTKLTCNGTGDGKVSQFYEIFRVWQHLANAEMISGQFTGVSGAGGSMDHVPGVNAPKLRISGAGTSFFYQGTFSNGFYFQHDYQHIMPVGGASSPWETVAPLFTPAEMLNIDNKYDDGRPGYGTIMSFKSSGLPGCTTTDDVTTAAYDTSHESKTCSFLYNLLY